MKGTLALVCLTVTVSAATPAQDTAAHYTFEWRNAPFRQTLEDAATAFNAVVFLGDAPTLRLTASMKVTTFEEALAILARMNKDTPWMRLLVPHGNPTYEQVELAVRSSTELRNFPFAYEDPAINRWYSWNVATDRPANRGRTAVVYFVGRPRDMTPARKPALRNGPASGISDADMQAVLNATFVMTAEQRRELRDMIVRMDRETQNAEEPLANGLP